MASVQHTYFGSGNPNGNPTFELEGAAVGIHHYQDLDSGDIFISTVYLDSGTLIHAGWVKIGLESALS